MILTAPYRWASSPHSAGRRQGDADERCRADRNATGLAGHRTDGAIVVWLDVARVACCADPPRFSRLNHHLLLLLFQQQDPHPQHTLLIINKTNDPIPTPTPQTPKLRTNAIVSWHLPARSTHFMNTMHHCLSLPLLNAPYMVQQPVRMFTRVFSFS